MPTRRRSARGWSSTSVGGERRGARTRLRHVHRERRRLRWVGTTRPGGHDMRDGRYEPDAAQFWGPRGGALPSGRRLLLLSYHFPPGQSVGALRWQQLSFHAAEHGWGLDVITLHPSSVSDPDMRRAARLTPGTRVYAS